MPGVVPPITRPQKQLPLFDNVKPMRILMPTPKAVPQRSPRLTKNNVVPTYTPLPTGTRNAVIITQDAINTLTHEVMNDTTDDLFMDPPYIHTIHQHVLVYQTPQTRVHRFG